MGKKRNLDDDMGQEGEGGGGDGRLHITDEIRKSIEYVINEKDKLKMQQDAIKEAITAIAAKMGCKPKQVSGIIDLVIKEQKEGGVLPQEEQRLEWTREVLEKMNLLPEGEV